VTRSFRLKRSYLYLSLGALALFVPLWGICAGFFIAAVMQGKPLLPLLAISLFFLGIPSFFVALSGYLLAACFREGLTLNSEGIEARGVFSTKRMSWAEIVEARWRMGLGLVLRGPKGRLKISFDNYARDEAREQITIFRRSLPKPVQRGWNRFWRMAWRLFDEPETPEIEAADRARLRRRMDLIFLTGTVAVLGVCVTVASLMGRWPILLAPAAIAVPWLFFRNSGVPSGQIAKALSISAEADTLVVVGFAVFIFSFCLQAFRRLLDLFLPDWLSFAGLAAAVALVAYGVYRQEQRTRPLLKRAAALAKKKCFGRDSAERPGSAVAAPTDWRQ
jgi:hypothetical protein